MITSEEYNQLIRLDGQIKGKVALNGAICFVGLFLTVVSLLAALNGGTYVVCFGAIVYGGYRFFQCIALLVDIRKQIKQAKIFFDELPNYANMMAYMLGYESFNTLEKAESTRLNYKINQGDHISDRLSVFCKPYGKSFHDLYTQVYDNYSKQQALDDSTKPTVGTTG